MAYNLALALMTGSDIPVPQCELTVHQPRLHEIALIGEEDFLVGMQTICINKSMLVQGETLLSNTNNFQIFMTVMKEKETADKKAAVLQLLPLLFPQFKAVITPQSLLLTSPGQTITIDDQNFEALQEVLKSVFCINTGPQDMTTFNPGNAKAKEIADKLMRARQRVAALKQDQEGCLFGRYISILTVGINSMSIQDCVNLTMYQLFDLVERYMLYVNWDLDIRSRLAGGKPDKQTENWMKDIHSKR